MFNCAKIIITTLPKTKVKTFVNRLLSNKLAACVNILHNVESVYWWREKIVTDNESILLIKTTKNNIRNIKNFFIEHHPYAVPELLIQDVKGSDNYINWLKQETKK